MKIIIMADRSSGNDRVGNMWTDTYIFDKKATLEDVLNTVEPNLAFNDTICTNIRIQLAQEVT